MGEVAKYRWSHMGMVNEHGTCFNKGFDENYRAESDYARLEREHAAAQAELTRLRAVEAEYAALQRFMRDRMPALIAARLAADDGYDPEDQRGGLYDLRWTGGAQTEPMGDAWSMDYLPRGEKIAADLAEACGRKG